MNNVNMTIETITPATAGQYLAMNDCNRQVRKKTVSDLAAEMKSGRFMLTGESIKFNGSSLIDGQHRLLACVSSGVSFECLVVRNLPTEVFAVIDSGNKRTVADVLATGPAGIKNDKCVAAAARLLLLIESNPACPPTSGSMTKRPLIIERIMRDVPAFDWAGDYGVKFRRWAGDSGAATFAMLALSAGHSHGSLLSYADGVVVGADLQAGDGRLAFRNWTASSAGAKRGSQRALVVVAAHIRAFNAYAADRKVSHIKPWVRTWPFPAVEPATPEAAARLGALPA